MVSLRFNSYCSIYILRRSAKNSDIEEQNSEGDSSAEEPFSASDSEYEPSLEYYESKCCDEEGKTKENNSELDINTIAGEEQTQADFNQAKWHLVTGDILKIFDVLQQILNRPTTF